MGAIHGAMYPFGARKNLQKFDATFDCRIDSDVVSMLEKP